MNNEQRALQRHLDMLTTAFGVDIAGWLKSDDVIEIMLNPDGRVWLDTLKQGKYLTDLVLSPDIAENVIKLVAAYKQTIADERHPEVACELPETSARFQGWLPPVVTAPTFTIRKRAKYVFTLDNYVETESLSVKQAEFLRRALKERKNILIAGGTASGKTTFANALLNELKDSQDRMIVLEDLPELQVTAKDCVTLRTSEQKAMRDLVKGVLRMRPDRIIIGEVRDGAALELLKAWNTGHPGGICTIHANSPEATISRLENLVQEVVEVVPKRLIQQAIDIIVFMRRVAGQYLVESIHLCEIENDHLCLKPF
ncbi:MAG: P-type conjugative transfer ATPase TrbB [Pseudomonadota bacterium]|nr:P-type conjugative transfer ATPase TrbB [Gammaproteobacteria bacterium]MBU1558191.1 P-type conjugative transfer ATPase TrbB [Gammaproteobacteria bacterium]MBU1628716.1 P-type conjugative transfer ATPase TrbB [Gammaproteobacteria bacterium]MBU1927102.1 P-type conjugative transfer ATPase TrbB [Gammaproteobacteria bacterium]MBU2545746.1 P-type conjugative transfer ATPase TrbB [Gammaproteobacteria bacterium]